MPCFGVRFLGIVSVLFLGRCIHRNDNVVSIMRVCLLEWGPEVLSHNLLGTGWNHIFEGPIVRDELALAISRVRVAIRLSAREDLNLLGVIVAEVLVDDGLFMGVGQLPHTAARVACLVGTGHPGFEEFFASWGLVGDHEAGVQVDVEPLHVEEERIIGILGQGHGGVVGYAPIIQEPFQWEMGVCEDGIAVHEDDVFVVLDGLTHRRDLVPGSVQSGVHGELHELIIIPVKLCCGGSQRLCTHHDTSEYLPNI